MTALIAVMCSLGCLGIGAVLAVVIMRGTVDQQKQREKERQNVSRLIEERSSNVCMSCARTHKACSCS
jgi:type II secretory pathway pseudopilin PulG